MSGEGTSACAPNPERDDPGVMAEAADAAEQVSNTKILDVVARFGFAVTGLLHVLIGAIGLRIAFGGRGDADLGGAVGMLAVTPAGPVFMWAGFLGCAGLALWQFSEATLRARHLPAGRRLAKTLSSGGLSVGYGSLALLFAGFAVGRGSDSGRSAQDFTAVMLRSPFGAPALVAVGAAVVAIGVHFIVKALRKKFKAELSFGESRRGHLLSGLGVTGHIAKGVALLLVGLLVIIAAVKHHPQESTGLDGSLKALPEQPYGVYLLAVIAVGLICYGVFAIVRARYGRM